LLIGFAVSDAEPVPAGGKLGVPSTGAVRVQFQNSLHETVFSVTRWMRRPGQLPDEQRAAAAARGLLADPSTTYSIEDPAFCGGAPICPSSRERYEEWVRLKEHEVLLGSSAIEFLCREMGLPRAEFDDAIKAQAQHGQLLDTAKQAFSSAASIFPSIPRRHWPRAIEPGRSGCESAAATNG
jgi:hypothetical protein